jgi:hypothetical protein
MRKHMRVPPSSALYRAFNDVFGRTHAALENQASWEVGPQSRSTPVKRAGCTARTGVCDLLTAMTGIPAVLHRVLR